MAASLIQTVIEYVFMIVGTLTALGKMGANAVSTEHAGIPRLIGGPARSSPVGTMTHQKRRTCDHRLEAQRRFAEHPVEGATIPYIISRHAGRGCALCSVSTLLPCCRSAASRIARWPTARYSTALITSRCALVGSIRRKRRG
jgi:hypothetical protein